MSGFKSKTLREASTVRYTEPRPIRPKGILHFTIGVSDLERARAFYEGVLGCTYWRQNDTTVFMRAGGDYFVLSKSGYHQPPNKGTDTLIHHAFIVEGSEFDAAMAFLEAKGVEVLLYEDKGHRSFTGRHGYFHDPDGNAIEIIDFQGIGDTTAPPFQGRERRRAKPHIAATTSK